MVQTSGKHGSIAEKVNVSFTCIPLIDWLSLHLYSALLPHFDMEDVVVST